MATSPRSRRFFQITMLCLLVSWSHAAPDKLLPWQKAPEHARSSGGRALLPPTSGQTPANVGKLGSSGSQAGPKQNSIPQQDDSSQRDESVSFKEVNGESVRVVEGNYGYQSPEGLPVSFKYTADENGSKASFTIGTATGGGTGPQQKPSTGIQAPKPGGGGAGNGNAAKGGARGGGPGTGGTGGGGTGKPDGTGGKGGIPGNEDRKYLPPN